jgi:YgiT-type zinc finger domain-containing protein
MSYDYGRCHVCGGAIEERLTDQSVRDADEWLVIRDVPTGVCTKCGEQVFRWHVTERLEEITRQRKSTIPTQSIEVPVFAFS